MALDLLMFRDTVCPQAFLVDVVGRVAIGPSGVAGTQSGKGFTMTRTGTGLYKVQFPCAAVPGILWAFGQVIGAVVGAAPYVVTVLGTSPATASLTLQTSLVTLPGTAADPPNGSAVMLRFTIQNAVSTG